MGNTTDMTLGNPSYRGMFSNKKKKYIMFEICLSQFSKNTFCGKIKLTKWRKK